MIIGIIELTQGNINNQHIYLAKVMHLFPKSSIGGSSKSSLAPKHIEIHSGIGQPIYTDISGDKKIFRKRGWVKEFFLAHNLKAGNKVVIEKTGRFRYHIYPLRTEIKKS